MRASRSATFLLSVTLVLEACAGLQSTHVNAWTSSAANFDAFATYAFVPVDQLDMKGSQMSDPVTRQNLEAALGRELQARGLSPAASGTKPSLLVSYFADVYEGLDEQQLRSEGPGGASRQRQGKLTVDVIDTASQVLVWRGEAWARDPNFRTAELIIRELLQKYPKAR